jgi:hypothetical protein
MPASTTQGNNDLGNIASYIQRIFDDANGDFNVAQAALGEFFAGTGPYASQYLGAGGTLTDLQNLDTFRSALGTINVPDTLKPYLDSMQAGIDQAKSTIAANGATADTTSLKSALGLVISGEDPTLANIRDYANQLISTGGYGTNGGELKSLYDTGQKFTANGGFTDALNQQQQAGLNILGTQGWNADSRRAMDQFQGMMAAGGQNADTQSLINQGKGLMANGGMTPQMQQLFNSVQQGIQANGATPQNQALLDAVMKIVNNGGQGGALIPMQQAQSFARDQAAQANSQAAEAAQRGANQRLGAAAGAGTAEEAMASFSNQAAQNEATGVQNATTQQQQLQLQQLVAALQTGGTLTGQQADLLKGYLNTGQQVTGQGVQNIQTGAGMQQSGQAAAQENIATGAKGVNDILDRVTSNLLAGNTMVSSANAAAQGNASIGAGMMGQAAGLANQNLSLGMGSLGAVSQTQLQAMNQLLGVSNFEELRNQNAMSNLGGLSATSMSTLLNSQAMQLSNYLQSMGMSADIANQYTQQWLSASNQFGQMGSSWLQTMPSFASAYGNIGSSTINNANYNPWTSIIQAGLGAVGTAAGAAIKSDRRLKTNIRREGTLGPFRTYSYDIDGHRDFGVMAQEIRPLVPEAVIEDPTGTLMVNYKKLLEFVNVSAT